MENKSSPVSSAPAFPLLLGICCAIFLSDKGFASYIAVSVAVLICLAWMLLGTERPSRYLPYAFAILTTLTVLLSVCFLARIKAETVFPSSIDTFGRITMNREWGRQRAIMIQTSYGCVSAYVPVNNAPPEGTNVRIRGAVFDFKRSDKKTDFDEYYFWRSKGASKKVVVLELSVISKPTWLHKWRNFIEQKIRDKLPERTAAYMLAITVGTRDKTLTQLHKNAGTVHLLAVSGFHVGILAALLGFIFRKRKSKIIFMSLGIWFYVFLTGASPGGLRAALMLQIYLAGLAVGRPSSAFNSVSMAGVLLLTVNPWSFYDIGWRLSMTSALFISAAGKYIKRSFISAGLLSMAVWFVTASQVAFYFKNAPVAGIFINAIAVPVFALIFPCIFLLSLPSLFGMPFALFFSNISEYLLEAWEMFSHLFTTLIPWSISYTMPLLSASALLFGAAAAFASDFPRRRISLASILCLAFVLLFA